MTSVVRFAMANARTSARRGGVLLFWSFLLLAVNAGLARAQESYPSRPVQMIVTFPSGMTTDIIARIFAEKMSQRLGQPVVVQNRPGAAGTIATQSVAVAAADGYTLLMAGSAHAVNPFLHDNLPYDSLRDFAGIALVGESPLVVLAHPSLGVRSVKELIALAKQKPGTINYPSGGIGSATHLAGALFASLAGIQLVHVPYKSMSNIAADLLDGRVQAAFFPVSAMLPQIQEGKLVALAVSSAGPMREPLALASVREAAGIDYVFSNWNGLLAPARTPLPILERLSRTVQQVAEDADVRDRFKALGVASRILAMRDFDVFIKADMDRLGPVVRASGTRAN